MFVQDLSSMIIDDHRSRVQFTQTSKEGMKNSQYEESDDGSCDFDTLSQDFDGCSGALEREDSYIYGSQPYKYNSTQSTTEKPIVQPEQHSDTRRRLHDEYFSADVSPTKRRYQETQGRLTSSKTSVDDSSSTTTSLQSDCEGSSDIQHPTRSFHARMMTVDDEDLDEYERLSGVESRSIGPSSEEDAESVSEQSTRKERWNSGQAA